MAEVPVSVQLGGRLQRENHDVVRGLDAVEAAVTKEEIGGGPTEQVKDVGAGPGIELAVTDGQGQRETLAGLGELGGASHSLGREQIGRSSLIELAPSAPVVRRSGLGSHDLAVTVDRVRRRVPFRQIHLGHHTHIRSPSGPDSSRGYSAPVSWDRRFGRVAHT